MTTNIAAVFGKDYLIRALALHSSATKYIKKPKFWFLCMDKESEELLKKLNLKNTIFKNVEDIGDPELMAVRGTRSFAEFAYTAKTSWLRYILINGGMDKEDVLMYIDSDIMFYSSADEVIEKCKKNGSITIIHNKFSRERDVGAKVGYYCGGLEIFRPDEESRKCIEEYRKQCIEWCYARPDLDNGRSTDQKYLDKWPKKYKEVYILPDKGMNVASWNIKSFKIRSSGNLFFIDADPLLCYHFHGFNFYLGKGNKVVAYPMTVFHNKIFKMHIAALQTAYSEIIKADSSWEYGFSKDPGILRLFKQNLQKTIRSIKFKINAKKYRL